MEKFNIGKVSLYQEFLIRNALTSYLFIQDHRKEANSWDFRRVFRDFYMPEARRIFRTEKINDAYFKCFNEQITLEGVLKALYEATNKTMQYSFATKAVHTMFPDKPIYDGNVGEYLKKCYPDALINNDNSKLESEERIEKIKESYASLCKWYESYIDSDEFPRIRDWFVKTFGIDESRITKTKMLDLIIWSYVKEHKQKKDSDGQ